MIVRLATLPMLEPWPMDNADGTGYSDTTAVKMACYSSGPYGREGVYTG